MTCCRRLALLCLVGIAALAAGDDEPRSVAPADYFHVAPHLAREYYVTDEPDQRSKILVSQFDQDGQARWSFLVPKQEGGFELVFGFDEGALYLYAFKVQSKHVDTDLVTLPAPALIGAPASVLGAPPVSTPVDARVVITVDLHGLRQQVVAAMTGAVRASWSAAEPLAVSPGQRFDDLVSLRLELSLAVSGEVFGMPMTREVETGLDGLLARDFGYVQFSTSKDVYRLLPPPSAANQRGSSDPPAPKDAQPSKP